MANLTDHTLEELVQNPGGPGSDRSRQVDAEFSRRQTLAQQEAATAAKETAEYTKCSATYMLYSVIVLAAASIVQVAVALLK